MGLSLDLTYFSLIGIGLWAFGFMVKHLTLDLGKSFDIYASVAGFTIKFASTLISLSYREWSSLSFPYTHYA